MSNKSPVSSIPLLPECTYHVYNRGNNKKDIFFEESNFYYFLKRYKDYTNDYFDTFAYCLLDNHFHFCFKVKSVEHILEKVLENKNFTLNKNFMFRHGNLYVSEIFKKENSAKLHLLDKNDLKNLKNIHNGVDEFLFSTTDHHSLIKYALQLYKEQPELSTSFEHHPLERTKIPFALQLCSYIVTEQIRRFFMSYSKAVNKQQNRTGSLFQKPFKRKWLASKNDTRTVISYIHHNEIHHYYGHSYGKYQWSSYKEYISRNDQAITSEHSMSLFKNKKDFILSCEDYRKIKEEVMKAILKYLNRFNSLLSVNHNFNINTNVPQINIAS